MSNTPRSVAPGRGLLVAGLALVCLIALLPAGPAHAAQGSGPTTALTGSVDDTPTPRTAFHQGGCLPAGGSQIGDPELPDGDFVLVGGGWGHGAGMSQYGAQGAALLGCSAEQILTTYFPGTQLTQVPQPDVVVLGLAKELGAVTLRADAGPIPFELCHYQTGVCETLPLTQPAGTTWTVQVQADATYRIVDGSGAEVFAGGDKERNLRALLSPDPSINRRVHVAEVGHTYRWGVLQIDSVQTGVPNAYLTLEIGDMDLYLRGLAEVPASWPAATLQAQAITGRSYALARINALGIRDDCRCHLYATPRDQNHEGWDHEAADAGIGGKWVDAVNATSGTVLTYDGQIAETFYSSSHGGHSESSAFVFGGALPYSQAVDDSRWDLASTNPLRRWTESFTAEEIGAAAGVGTATAITPLEPLGAAGRIGSPSRGYGGVRIEGDGGAAVLSGDELKSRLGLRSTLVRVGAGNVDQPTGPAEPNPPPPPPPPPPADGPTLQRVSGGNRIATAVAVSQHGWDVSEHVVLAAADRFPDALAGIALAASLDAPLLLSDQRQLSQEAATEIGRLGASTAWLLGGTSALSAAVRGDLADLGITTRRLAGDDRSETAAAIAVTAAGTSSRVLLVPADNWPDAVSASSIAALLDGPPILLAGRDEVGAATVDALATLQAEAVTLVGGTAVLTPSVAQELAELGYTVDRLAGSNRFETSTAVAGQALGQRAGQDVPLIAASGSGFADALPAGALAARDSGVLMLAPQSSLSDAPSVRDFLSANATTLGTGLVVGGTTVISDRVSQELAEALDGG